jgi:hypothetical protein
VLSGVFVACLRAATQGWSGSSQLSGNCGINWNIEEFGTVGGGMVGATETARHQQAGCNGDAQVQGSESVETRGTRPGIERIRGQQRYSEIAGKLVNSSRVWMVRL